MKKFVIFLGLFLSMTTVSYAVENINKCYNCKVIYNNAKPVVKAPVVPVAPAAPAVVPVVPVGPGYVAPVVPYVNGPPVVYAAPYYEQPVAVTTNAQCAWYVDQYDLFGQLFGNPDLVQSCW